ncbi:type II secretion system F family protein, partial [Candidatus Woesearchaeota archaeon]|nr:type II secretion system F family protein [Candidatus Woesearchaeota archaeon]
ILGYAVTYLFIIQIPKGIIRRREREINKEILFAGRYLLVKLESGMPLFNALIDISKSYGVAAKYFKEIVDDIQTGTPIEEALEKAREYNASKKFQRILWQIVTSLKTGIEVSSSLRTTLKDITNEQILEIKAYGKTLNSLMMFYMILGCVLPSLGVALFTIFSSFLSLQITSGFIFFMVFILIVIQVAFIIFIHATRPMVNL